MPRIQMMHKNFGLISPHHPLSKMTSSGKCELAQQCSEIKGHDPHPSIHFLCPLCLLLTRPSKLSGFWSHLGKPSRAQDKGGDEAGGEPGDVLPTLPWVLTVAGGGEFPSLWPPRTGRSRDWAGLAGGSRPLRAQEVLVDFS